MRIVGMMGEHRGNVCQNSSSASAKTPSKNHESSLIYYTRQTLKTAIIIGGAVGLSLGLSRIIVWFGSGRNDAVPEIESGSSRHILHAERTHVDVQVYRERRDIAAPVFPEIISVGDLDGSNGFRIDAEADRDQFGVSVSNAGDVNGDGLGDVIIGAMYADSNKQNDAGASYIVFGQKNGFPPILKVSTLNCSNGFVINGIDVRDASGRSVSNAGDMNGDGVDDVIIGAHYADPNNNDSGGESYVVFGSKRECFHALNLTDLDGNNGVVIHGVDDLDLSGNSVSNAGDVNGDGVDDVIIGASYGSTNGNNKVGESYVVFGSRDAFSHTLNLANLNGSNGFTIYGLNTFDRSGSSVSNAGDINGDGVDDVIIGTNYLGQHRENRTGECYVVFGSKNAFHTLNVTDLNGRNGFVINGLSKQSFVSNMGDINGDGIGDVIIGAPFSDSNRKEKAGKTYAVFGSRNDFPKTLHVSELNGRNGFVINGVDTENYSGRAVSNAGDVNGDGIDDALIGAFRASPGGLTGVGECYVVFGRKDNVSPVLELSALNGSNGFTIRGVSAGDIVGRSVSNAGDINGDGLDDLIIGARHLNVGVAYIIFGRKQPTTTTSPTTTSTTIPTTTTTTTAIATSTTLPMITTSTTTTLTTLPTNIASTTNLTTTEKQTFAPTTTLSTTSPTQAAIPTTTASPSTTSTTSLFIDKNDDTSSSSGSTNIGPIIGAVIGGVLVMGVGGVLIMRHLRKSQTHKDNRFKAEKVETIPMTQREGDAWTDHDVDPSTKAPIASNVATLYENPALHTDWDDRAYDVRVKENQWNPDTYDINQTPGDVSILDGYMIPSVPGTTADKAGPYMLFNSLESEGQPVSES